MVCHQAETTPTTWRRSVRHVLLLWSLVVLILGATLLTAESVGAQVADGATMTVLQGQVAIVRSDGSATQPAPSGSTVQAGDEIRTLADASAIITFFSGTEIELGERTTLVVERVSQNGGRVDISLRQVFGTSLHRVQSLADAGSSYRVDVGGAVAVVRGTTFLVYGPTDENVVGIVCTDDCTEQTTFAGCPMGPNVAYWTEVDRGRVVSACRPFRPSGSIWDAPGELRLRSR